MDWVMVSMLLAAGAVTAAGWKVYQLKKEVWQFTARIEEALDDILSGRGFGGDAEGVKDTLWGKCSGKLSQADRIWRKKEEAYLLERKQMKELISDISHQTKTPIANMKLYLEFLQEEELSEKGTEFLKNLEGQADRLDFLLQSMVKMSRLEAGIIQIKSETGNLYKTLAKAMTEIVPAAAGKQIELSADIYQNQYFGYRQGDSAGKAGGGIYPVLPGTGGPRKERRGNRIVSYKEDPGAAGRLY